AFTFEAESHLPYPLEQCLVDKVYLHSTNSATQLQLFGVLKSDLQQHLDTLQKEELDPELVCPKPLAICHFVKQFCPSREMQIVIDIDNQETTYLLVKDRLPLMARFHPVGLEKLESVTYVDQTGQVAINDNELAAVHQYLREISRILLAFQHGY